MGVNLDRGGLIVENKYEFVSEKEIRQLSRMIPVGLTADVIVVGGGVAGLAAAVAAGRLGVKTVLIERNSFIGGTATAGGMTLFTIPHKYTSGITREIYDRLKENGGAVLGKVVPFDPEVFKFVALSMLEEAGVECRFYSYFSDVIKVGDSIEGVVVESKSQRQAFLGKAVIDTTGDADVAYMAGVPTVKGREEDGRMRPMSLIFRMGNVNIAEIEDYWKSNPKQFSPDPGHSYVNTQEGIVRLDGFFDIIEEGRKLGKIHSNAHYLRIYGISGARGEVFINSTRMYNLDGTNAIDLTKAEFEGRHQMRELITYLKERVPGFRESYLIDSACNLGVRETRRIIGEYILTESDLEARYRPEDVVFHDYAHQVPGVEIHSPDAKEGASDDPYVRQLVLPMNDFYFPYRCLLPKAIDRLLVGGRCVSVTHEADSWTRGMPTCMLTGQAAGVAAALSVIEQTSPKKLNPEMIRHRLIQQGVDVGI
jgi:ribulose 1,5-bisphosphate synthetase/thiazole synthase